MLLTLFVVEVPVKRIKVSTTGASTWAVVMFSNEFG